MKCSPTKAPFDTEAADEAGLVTFAPDDLDWEDEIRWRLKNALPFRPML